MSGFLFALASCRNLTHWVQMRDHVSPAWVPDRVSQHYWTGGGDVL